ncbi:uncharacterized protein PITG_12485 [Phytophthora infestans T30-4]|uniref:5'-3' DNA helicase ZGRF1-like N-terminal domain-containing protein n=2 Tax=Phytophthora infestans TaxID=4787 RepID=D0NKM7_PHYIT|nr:uncharacterized protein PITG_12485 [Phytophthora infestans T30-4]EEY60163.1 conserved hypothetical protein [Phytophthora infestans T30-4]KAF4041569.1 hypothetical protein GN244_ATG06079 [Phytophthora infestans]KAF4147633.1 hypothetical protein GN958_ATG03178 [Phytophthora infestans]|eukprot:XP_002900370.1 conserved hypothetical protein [Phytophthora infestans T30-4]
MTKLCDLLGSRPEVMYECMYTKHKTQKRKIWQDGFVALATSRRLVVYADDDGKAGKAVDEAKLTPTDWDRKDEEYFETSKFLVEIVNETPIGSTTSVQTANSTVASVNSFESASSIQQSTGNGAKARPGPPAGLGGRPRFSNSKFRTPLGRGPSRLATSGAPSRVGHLYGRSTPVSAPIPTVAPSSPTFDFARKPTSEWEYVPNAVSRTPDEVLALLEK